MSHTAGARRGRVVTGDLRVTSNRSSKTPSQSGSPSSHFGCLSHRTRVIRLVTLDKGSAVCLALLNLLLLQPRLLLSPAAGSLAGPAAAAIANAAAAAAAARTAAAAAAARTTAAAAAASLWVPDFLLPSVTRTRGWRGHRTIESLPVTETPGRLGGAR